jgi:rod shape-determining protein MreC
MQGNSRDDFIIALRYALLKKGTKQKFSLFFLILFSILIIILDKLSFTPIKTTRAVLNDFVYRVTMIVVSPGKLVTYLGSKAIKHINIYDEVKTLRSEVRVLKTSKYDSLFLMTENKNLKLALGLENVKSNEEDTITIARVMIDQESPYLKSLIINKGTKSGIVKGMTVFSRDYLIGLIVETNYLSSRVLLISDLNSKLPAIIQDSDVNVILSGSGDNNDLILEYLPDNFVLEPNRTIFTSGKDGLLAIGMPVAETYLNKDNVLKVRALADPQQALIVHVTRGQFRN